jgi:sporulation protein YlmC with PRC-barrel domain
MATMTFTSLSGLQIISSDAYRIGDLADIRYNVKWKVVGLTTRTDKSLAKMIPSIGSGRSLIRIEPKKFIINDVILMKENTSELGPMITADTDNAESLSFLGGKKVVSSEGVILGTVYDVNVDTDLWTVPAISVKLDKIAFEPLGLKKGLFSKTVISIRTEYVASAGEMVTLNQGVRELREEIVVE